MVESTTTDAGQSCHAYASFDYQAPSIIVGVICFITGIIYCFFGYRFFKAVLFLSGFLFGSVLIYLVCEREQLLPMLGNAGVAVGAGVLFGLVTMLVQYVGLFISGFLTGLLVGVVVMSTWLTTGLSPPSTIWTTIGVLFGAGLIFALISLKWQKLMIILNTALVGGALLTSSLDYFADNTAILSRTWEAVNVRVVWWDRVCWYGWLVLATWPALFALGFVTQWRWTSVGFNHKEGWRQFRRRRRTNECLPSADRPRTVVTHGRGSYYVTNISAQENTTGNNGSGSTSRDYEPRSWRSIYQSRRMHGDVICQKYLGRLPGEKRARDSINDAPAQESVTDTPTFASDHTRLTALTNESNKSHRSEKDDSNSSS